MAGKPFQALQRFIAGYRSARKPGLGGFANVRNMASSWNAGIIGLSGYNATDPRRKILLPGQRPARASANELAMASLPVLRNHSRHLERNHPTARAGVDGLVALVVGTGIALEPDTGNEEWDKLLREEWLLWSSRCTVDGRDMFAMQTRGFRDVVVAGEMLWRWVILDERSAAGDVPLALLPLECEWIDDIYSGNIVYIQSPEGWYQVGATKLDKYGRAVSYRIRNPEYNSLYPSEEVPASALMHVYEKRRSMQARGEPWLAPVIERLSQDNDLVDTELQAAITASSIGLAVTTEAMGDDDTTELGSTEDPVQSLRLGGVTRMHPGESVEAFSHNRPSQAIAPFRAGIRGDIAAALRLPVRFLDRDVSKANYSSMRADMLDTARLLAPVREWYGHDTAGAAFVKVLPYLCIRAGIPYNPRYRYRLIPDGEPYVDPQKDVGAAISAIAAGLSTWELEVGKRGGDAKKMLEQLKTELKDPVLMKIWLNLVEPKTAGSVENSEEPAEKTAVSAKE